MGRTNADMMTSADDPCAPSRSIETRDHAGAMIIERGRGPEIAGTRITIYDVMEFLKSDFEPAAIAEHLEIDRDQVMAAIDYIALHRDEAEREYELIVERASRPVPPEVEQRRARTRAELEERLRSHLGRAGARDHRVGP